MSLPPAKKLSRRHSRAAFMIAAGYTDEEIAADVKVKPATVRRWRYRPDIRARVSEICNRD